MSLNTKSPTPSAAHCHQYCLLGVINSFHYRRFRDLRRSLDVVASSFASSRAFLAHFKATPADVVVLSPPSSPRRPVEARINNVVAINNREINTET